MGVLKSRGIVTDAGGAVLPGVTITATNEGTGLERTTVTGGEGRYIIPSLLPGPYTIKADLSGFQTTRRTGVVLNVGQEATLNMTLEIAGVAETLTVTAEAPLVESTSSRIGTNVTSSEIDSLPSANRSQFSLMQTIPGLVPLAPGRLVRGRAVQRQRPGDDEQPVPGRRPVRQRLAPRRIAGHAGARLARLDGRVPGADAPVRRRVPAAPPASS